MYCVRRLVVQVGESEWHMTKDGLLAVAWKDVGDTKGMYVVLSFCFYLYVHVVIFIMQVQLSRANTVVCHAPQKRSEHSRT